MYGLLDGRLVADSIIRSLHIPNGAKMAIVLVGDDPASHVYVRNKIRVAESLGVFVDLHKCDSDITEDELISLVDRLNNDDINGIIVQLPLPKHINASKVLNRVNPSKDIDGLHPYNYGRLILDDDLDHMMVPATPLGIYLLLKHYDVDTCGKQCVIVGRGLTVGTPLGVLLSKNVQYGNMTVTLCHSKTSDLKDNTLLADVLVVATGVPYLITADMVKPGVVVIDVGISRVPDNTKKSGVRIVGDVDFENVKGGCSYITPVPGGVGPMTIAALMSNLCKACSI